MERRCMRPAMHSRNTCSARMVTQLKSKCGTSTWSAAPSLYSQVESNAYLHACMHACKRAPLHFSARIRRRRHPNKIIHASFFSTRFSAASVFVRRPLVLTSACYRHGYPECFSQDFPWDFCKHIWNFIITKARPFWGICVDTKSFFESLKAGKWNDSMGRGGKKKYRSQVIYTFMSLVQKTYVKKNYWHNISVYWDSWPRRALHLSTC